MCTGPEVIAVLVHAATGNELVAVQLRDGQTFRDGVCEVFSACGAEYVIFHAHNRIHVNDITHCRPLPACVEAVA